MNKNSKTSAKVAIPVELKSLPIFQVLGDNLPAKMKSPEAKKTAASALFWITVIGGSFFFFKNLPTLIEYAKQSVLFLLWGIAFITLLLLAPRIIELLNTIGTTLLFKGERNFVRSNPIPTLRLLEKDAKDTLKKVKEKIASVDGVRTEMVMNSESAKKETEEKYRILKQLTAAAAKLDEEAKELEKGGDKQTARSKKRKATEKRADANLRLQEGKASEEMARVYAQYANQFGKAHEILKDNESAARIYTNALSSSISIIDKKMEATKKMRNATEGLADVFNIKDEWKFNEAMDAATSSISHNIANIRSNLDFLDESRIAEAGMPASQQDLESFVHELEAGRLKTLNISEISDPGHKLTQEQKVDKGFNLLD